VPLQPATARHRHDALDVTRATGRLRAEADLAPDDEATQRALGQVVGWLHARRVDERPQCTAPVQNVAAGARRLRMAAIGALPQQRLDPMAQEQHVAGKHVPAQCAIPHPLPEAKHALRQSDQLVAYPPRLAASLGDLGEVAQQVRPAQLPALGVHPGIGGLAVRHQDAGKALAQCRSGRLRAARGRGQEHRHRAGHDHPQPVAGPVLFVARLVGMHDGRLLHMGMRVRHDFCQCIADHGFALADGTDRQFDAEQVGQHALHLPLAQVVAAGERTDGRHQARPRHAGRNAGRQVGLAWAAACLASAGKEAVFGHHGCHRRQVDDLMSGVQPGHSHRAAAPRARSRFAIVGVRDGFGRQQRARLAGMAGLGAALSARGRLRRRRAMRVGRGRLGGIMRIGMQFLFQHLDALRQLAHHQPQFVDQRLRFFERAGCGGGCWKSIFIPRWIGCAADQFPLTWLAFRIARRVNGYQRNISAESRICVETKTWRC